jgi:signal transduction histidine kinase
MSDPSSDLARSRFLADVAHELRTPAALVAGYISMLREGSVQPEEALPLLEAQALKLCAIIDDMLRLADTRLAARERWSEQWRDRLAAARAENQRLQREFADVVERARRQVRAKSSQSSLT